MPEIPPEVVAARPAASLVVLDDRPDLHVLVGRRRADLDFAAGLVVFPGGALESCDSSPLAAALRETGEETGWWPQPPVPGEGPDYPHVGHWITPEESHRRYDTHFFLARFSGGGALTADKNEFDAMWWDRPAVVLRRIESGELDAIAPTLSMLTSLVPYRTADAAFAGADRGVVRRFPWGETWF